METARKGADIPSSNPVSWTAEIMEANDYYPFGQVMPSRTYAFSSTKKARVGYQSGEKDLEIENNAQTTYFRELELDICRWWGLDPRSSAWESPYASMRNNPICYMDILGDKVDPSCMLEDKKGSEALRQYMSTDEGLNYLAKFAQKGQTILGHTFTKDGEFHTQGIDLKLDAFNFDKSNVEDVDAKGTTGRRMNGKRLEIIINLNTDPRVYLNKEGKTPTKNEELYTMTEALFHETFIHADQYQKDFKDDNIINYSNISEVAKTNTETYGNWGSRVPNHYHHEQMKLNYINSSKTKTTIGIWPYKAVDALRKVSQNLGLNKSDCDIEKQLWDYSGGFNLQCK